MEQDPHLTLLTQAVSDYKSSIGTLDQEEVIKQLIQDLSTITID